MQYIFENYRFDACQQILYKNEQIISLRTNEAKLLNLFLSRPDEVLSKDVILDEVWGEREVSEQVVFQNVSHLRTVISDRAIKTFPKKGYKWQLALEVVKEPNKHRALIKNSKLWIALAITFVCILLLNAVKPEQGQGRHFKPVTINLIPIEYQQAEGDKESSYFSIHSLIEYNKSKNFSWRLASSELTARTFFDSPSSTRESLNLTKQQMLLSGFISSYNDGMLLRYQLQGELRKWSGYLFGRSGGELSQQLNVVLQRILSSQYFSLKEDALVTSELTLLHDRYPSDHQVLQRLVERHIEQKDFDLAKALVDKLIAQSIPKQHTAYLGYGYMLKGKIFHLMKSLNKAQQFYQLAHQVLATRNLLYIQSLVSKNQGWLGYYRQDHEQVKSALLQAAVHSNKAGEELAEIEAYTLLSILSSKLGFDKERYDYLYKAKSLLTEYGLNKSNYAVIYYHFALFAETPQEAKPYYEKILALPFKQENEWIIEDTQNHLVQFHIANKNWTSALRLIPEHQSTPFSFNQRAKIYQAMGELNMAMDYAEKAFSLARINYNYIESLNAALLLYQMSAQSGDSSSEAEYRLFIESNSNEQWRKANRAALQRLGYFSA